MQKTLGGLILISSFFFRQQIVRINTFIFGLIERHEIEFNETENTSSILGHRKS